MLAKKLQLKPGMRFIVVNAPEGFEQTLGSVPDDVKRGTALRGAFDLILLFVRDKNALKAKWPGTLAAVKESGLLWVAYPKKSSGISSDLATMNSDWEVYTGSPWQPVSSISIDDTWSCVRFKHAPGLDERRARRAGEIVHDADGTVCIDRENRVIAPPRDLETLLKKNRKAGALFDGLSFTNRREYVQWILDAKRPETRAQRCAQAIERLSAGRKNPFQAEER